MFPLNYLLPKTYYEVALDSPIVLTPTPTAQAIMPAYPYKWVFSFLIKLRSKGTSTYVGIGNRLSQDWRLTYTGQVFGFSGNQQEVIDLTKIYYISDTSDATIEVVAAYMPIPMQGEVYLSQNRSIG
jgi:hypothetical protein